HRRLATRGSLAERVAGLRGYLLSVLFGAEVVDLCRELADCAGEVGLSARLVVDDPHSSLGDGALEPKCCLHLTPKPRGIGADQNVERPGALGECRSERHNARALLNRSRDRVVLENADDGAATRLGEFPSERYLCGDGLQFFANGLLVRLPGVNRSAYHSDPFVRGFRCLIQG